MTRRCRIVRQVRVIRVDAKSRKVDLSQRSEDERAADKKLAEKGAGTVKVAGMNQLQAALARAGIQKTDFVDLSKVRQYHCVHSITEASRCGANRKGSVHASANEEVTYAEHVLSRT